MKLIKTIVLYLCFALIMGFMLDVVILKAYYFIKNPVKVYAISEITIPNRKKEDMRTWVLNAVKEAGLNPAEADCLIKNESNWDANGWLTNWDNKAGTDQGLWAINTLYHPEVSHVCAFDYHCATREAIRIRKANGSWDAWHGFTNKCIK